MIRGTLLHELVNLPFYWNEIKVLEGLQYPVKKLFFGEHARQYCLIAEPTTPPLGWVVYWHGGGWHVGSPEQFQKTALPWLNAGYGVVLPSYRRLPRYAYSAIRQDIINSMKACRHYWKSLDGNPFPPVILLGMSAGGHLAAITGLDAGIYQQAGWEPGQIKGVIACGAVLDFSLMSNNPVIRLLAGTPQGATFAQANPSAQLVEEKDFPSFLLIHGTKDGMVPYQAATGFQKRYQEIITSSTCDLITLPEGTHLDAARWMFRDTPLRQTILSKAREWINGKKV